jgi:LPXTG-motif cell wall-anchored protein
MAHKEGKAFYPGTARQPKLFAVYDRDIEQGSGDLGNFFGPAQLVRWPNHEGFLATVRGKVMHVTLENLVRPSGEKELFRVPEPRFKFTPVGSDNFNVTSFGVDNDGEFIFYPAVREGTPGYRYDKDGKASAKKDVEEHDVMACRLRNGKFSDPFVFCEVDYDMDTLVVCGSQKSVAMAFLSTNLTNAKKSEAEIRFTAMPNTRCANVIGFNAVTDVVFPGIACPFNVTIRNDGNTYLAGCSIRLHRRGKKNNKTDTVTKLTFSKTTLVPSNYNPKKADGSLEDVEPDYALAPGKTSVYTLMLVVPKDWSGKVEASATAQDFVAASMKKVGTASVGDLLGVQSDALSVQDESTDESTDEREDEGTDEREDEGFIDMADQYEGVDYDLYDYDVESIEYAEYSEPGTEYDEDGDEFVDYIVEDSDYDDDDLLDYPYDEFEVVESDELEGEELSDAPIEGDGEPEDDGGPWGDGGTGGDGGRRSKLPETGDPASGMGAIGAGLAAAGAAMVAYSRRRVENERAASGGRSSGDGRSEG